MVIWLGDTQLPVWVKISSVVVTASARIPPRRVVTTTSGATHVFRSFTSCAYSDPTGPASNVARRAALIAPCRFPPSWRRAPASDSSARYSLTRSATCAGVCPVPMACNAARLADTASSAARAAAVTIATSASMPSSGSTGAPPFSCAAMSAAQCASSVIASARSSAAASDDVARSARPARSPSSASSRTRRTRSAFCNSACASHSTIRLSSAASTASRRCVRSGWSAAGTSARKGAPRS